MLTCWFAVLISCDSPAAAKLVETEAHLRKELESTVAAHAEANREVSRLSAELETCMRAREEVAAENGEGGPQLSV